MNRLSFSELLKERVSYYSVVIGVAKLARSLVDDAKERGEIITEKPVSLAIEEIANGSYTILESGDIGRTIE